MDISYICDTCGGHFEARKHRHKRNRCQKCSARINATGNKWSVGKLKYVRPAKDILIDLHHVQKLGRQEIAKRYKVSGPVVARWFRELDIQFIGRTERDRPPKQELIELHHDRKMTLEQLQLHYGKNGNPKGGQFVRKWLKYYGIEQRLYRSLRKPRLSPERLYELHIKEQKSFKTIAKMCGVSDSQVGLWAKAIDLENVRHSIYISNAQTEIRDFLLTEGFDFRTTRKILKGREIDLYNAERNFGIEYCGLYWHRKNALGTHYHLDKLECCLELGIPLLTIFEDEWLEKQEIVKSIILAKLKRFHKIIGARECKVLVDNNRVKGFLIEHHLQGPPNRIDHSVSLEHRGELIGTMTFGPHPRSNDKLVLSRLCFAKGTMINGGAEALFSRAKKIIKQRPIITWADRRWSQGNVYTRLGFHLSEILPPDYSYCARQQRRSKSSMRKSLINCPPDVTEAEWCEKLGWEQIYDCGKLRFEYGA